MIDLTKLSAAKLQALYEKRSAISHATCKAAIAAGFGHMRGSEIREMAATAAAPEWAKDYVAAHDAFFAVVDEQNERKRYHGSMRPIKRAR